jgi:hypothetical protein
MITDRAVTSAVGARPGGARAPSRPLPPPSPGQQLADQPFPAQAGRLLIVQTRTSREPRGRAPASDGGPASSPSAATVDGPGTSMARCPGNEAPVDEVLAGYRTSYQGLRCVHEPAGNLTRIVTNM